MKAKEIRFQATERTGDVGGLFLRPGGARCLLVLAHGAGAGMRHPFMEEISAFLAEERIATFRYQFPYAEQGRNGPNPAPVLMATVRSAVSAAATAAADLPLLAGGKSMGGRMTSRAAAESPLEGVRGLVFFGFPLHAAGSPSAERGEHLLAVEVPMLFVQGARDKLADLGLLRPLCERLGRRATLHVVADGDHSFGVRKSSGRDQQDVMKGLAGTVGSWASRLGGGKA